MFLVYNESEIVCVSVCVCNISVQYIGIIVLKIGQQTRRVFILILIFLKSLALI